METMFPVLVLALFVVIAIVLLRFGPTRDKSDDDDDSPP
jgi:hypothetical protein